LIKLPFIETVFHILNRNMPKGTEVWPPGSLDINPFDYLKCDVTYLGEVLTDPLIKKQSLGRTSRGPAAISYPGWRRSLLLQAISSVKCKVQI
jgi:hypothetical protein